MTSKTPVKKNTYEVKNYAFTTTLQNCEGLKLDELFYQVERFANKNNVRLYTLLLKSEDTTESQVKNNCQYLANRDIIAKLFFNEKEFNAGLSRDGSWITNRIEVEVGKPIKI